MSLDDLNKLDYGYCYIVKGNSDKLLWGLRDSPNLTITSIEHLPYIWGGFTPSKTTYVVPYFKQLKLPDTPVINKLCRVFIWLPTIDDSLEEPFSTIYKKYQSSKYKSVDLTVYNLKRSLKTRLTKLKNNIPDLNYQLEYELALHCFDLDSYANHPLTVNSIIKEEDIDSTIKNINFLSSRNYSDRTLANLLIDFAKKKSFTPITFLLQMPTVALNDFFYKPNLYFTQFYKITSVKGLFPCNSLRYWYSLFFYRYMVKWGNTKLGIKGCLRVFFYWVYRASTINSSYTDKGLDYFIKGKSAVYYFRPSQKSIDEFFNLIN
jgi:hypothetical protein